MSKKSILDIVQEYGLDITQEGNVVRAYCPFHDDSGRPNFTIYETTNSWFCFACNEGGNPILFISKIENISYSEAQQKYNGNKLDFDEIREKLDSVNIADDFVKYNDELNIAVSSYCRNVIQNHPEKQSEVLQFLQTFDYSLLQPVSYEKMQQILKDVKQKFLNSEL